MEVIKVTTKEQLKELYDCSAMTWEGLVEEDFETALNEGGAEGAKGYLTTGKVMNEICHLTGSNAYRDDCNIFSIDKYRRLAISLGARWMDDIIDNNALREDYHPFKRFGGK